MKNYLVIILSITFTLVSFAQEKSKSYQYKVDLIDVKNDMVDVELIVPENEYGNTCSFYFPRIVPGTYSVYDFARFIHEFKALDSKGKELEVKREEDYSWTISNANDLYKITYRVEDSYDSEKDTVIFEPAGTNIDKGQNYLINNFGFFGYLDSLMRIPFDITFEKPRGFYGTTPLKTLINSEVKDRFLSVDYYELIDSPILYSKPDTASIDLNGTQVVVSSYSPGGKMDAKELLEQCSEVLSAQASYLGGKLPVDKYVIIIMGFDKLPKSRLTGALEHNNSTVFTTLDMSASDMTESVIRVVAHEFFHIVTPLAIHSEEIHDFDFQNPRMSKHLWFYEGLTEYAANHFQLKEGMVDLDEFLNMMRVKIRYSKRLFNDTLPFTELSKKTLGEYHREYGNVYMKGALIGLALDIELRSLSGGDYGTQELVRDLSNLYGKDKAFKDDEFFDQIAQLTYPEIRQFFSKYVEGNEPLPYKTYFKKIGIHYFDSLTEKEITLGQVGLGYNSETNRLTVSDLKNANAFAEQIGYEIGDEIVAINGKEINGGNANVMIKKIKTESKPGDEISITLARFNKRGKEKIIETSAAAMEIKKQSYHVLKPDEAAKSSQLALRRAWGNT